MHDPYEWTEDEKAPYMVLVAAFNLARSNKDYKASDFYRARLAKAGVEVVEDGAVFNPFRETREHRLARIAAREVSS